MAKVKENEYYKGFVEGVGYACKAAELLKETLTNFKPSEIERQMTAVHSIEHSADIMKHTLTKKLVKEFITPIEREDIMSLFEKIDDVTDAMDDVLMRIYMNNITSIRNDVAPFADLIVKCSYTLKNLMDEFPNFKKSTNLTRYIIELNTLEEDGDRLYTAAMHRLHMEAQDAREIIVWREVYDYLEKCCDACEHTADVVEHVIMKNS